MHQVSCSSFLSDEKLGWTNLTNVWVEWGGPKNKTQLSSISFEEFPKDVNFGNLYISTLKILVDFRSCQSKPEKALREEHPPPSFCKKFVFFSKPNFGEIPPYLVHNPGEFSEKYPMCIPQSSRFSMLYSGSLHLPDSLFMLFNTA